MFFFKNACIKKYFHEQWCSNTVVRLPKMQPINPLCDPRSFHGWSAWQPMKSKSFAENISEWKQTDISMPFFFFFFFHGLSHVCHTSWEATIKICTIIFYCMKMQIKDNIKKYLYQLFLIDFMVSADHWLMDHPELRWTTQPSTIGGPYPGFRIFHSTAWSIEGN